MARAMSVSENVAQSARHSTFYLACGGAEAPPVIFVHGWPELSLSWRHQLPCVAALGFRGIAPDMRGYGRSSVYARHEDYAVEHAVADILESAAERVEVLHHAVGIDDELVDHAGKAAQREVERDGRIRPDDALDRGMRDVALMPEGDVLHCRERVGADEAGEAADVLREHRVALVRHRR